MSAATNPPIVRVRQVRLESIVGETRLYATTDALAALAGAPASMARVPEAAWLAAASGALLISHTVLVGSLTFGVLVLAGVSSWLTLPAMMAATGWASLTAWTARRSLRQTFAAQGSTWPGVGLLLVHSAGGFLASIPGCVALAVALTQVGLGRRALTSTDLALLVATLLVPISGMLCWAPASDAAALAESSRHHPPSVALRVLTHTERPAASASRPALNPGVRAMVWVGGLRDDVASRWEGLAALAIPRAALILSAGAAAGTAFLAWSWGAAPSVIVVPGAVLVAASQAITIRHLLIWLESEPFPRSAPKAITVAGTTLLLVAQCATQASAGFLGALGSPRDEGTALAVRDGSAAVVAVIAITALVGSVHSLAFAVLPTHRYRWRTAAALIRLHDQAARNRSPHSV